MGEEERESHYFTPVSTNAHRTLLGHLPAVEFSHNIFPNYSSQYDAPGGRAERTL